MPSCNSHKRFQARVRLARELRFANKQASLQEYAMKLLLRTLDFIFGCHHGKLSRPFTIDRHTYRVCCHCGARFDYSLQDMRTGHRLPPEPGFRWLEAASE